jgi:hypothetical protein
MVTIKVVDFTIVTFALESTRQSADFFIRSGGNCVLSNISA